MSDLARDEERRHARHGTLRGGVKVRVRVGVKVRVGVRVGVGVRVRVSGVTPVTGPLGEGLGVCVGVVVQGRDGQG